ncbi:MAG TPA: TolC family protein [Longimicrobiales bacterium]|nr:TolC family protein [Longimicrobiales bacterium]
MSRLTGNLRAHVCAAAFLSTFTLAASDIAAQSPEPVTLTLEEVVRRTLLNSPQVVQAQGAVQTAGASELSAIGAFLPSLNISSGAALSSTQRFDPNTNVVGSSDSYNAGISTGVDLFTGGRRGAQLTQARAETRASEASLVQQRYTVMRNAKAAYYDVARASDLIRSAEARLQRAEEGLAAAQLRSQAGSATRSDVLRAELERANARQGLLQANNQKRAAMYALGRLVAIDGPADIAAEDALTVAELDLSPDELLQLALSQAPAVITAEANENAARAGVRLARAQYMPTLNGSGSYNWNNDAPSFSDLRSSWSLRMGLSFPVFNRFAREESVERSSVQATVARYQLEDARRATRASLEGLLGTLETSRQAILIAREALALAEEDLRVQQERYRLGVSTILEQVTSQENLVTAEISLISAQYDYQLALAELEALIGREL